MSTPPTRERTGPPQAGDRETMERFRLHELIGRYVDALNHRDWTVFADLWVEDASLNVEFDVDPQLRSQVCDEVKLRSKAEILRAVQSYDKMSWLFQVPTGIVVELEDDVSAKARHTLHVNSYHFTMLGICYDRFTRCADGAWRFVNRDYRPSYYSDAKPPGVATRNMPDPNYRAWPRVLTRDG
jgi:hypothetical protein